MAQQDCGQCGYLCESYSAAIAAGAETKLNLCVPGGKETSRMLKRLLEEVGGPDAPATMRQRRGGASEGAGEPGYSRDNPVEAVFRSATRINGEGSEKDTHHVVIDISGAGSTMSRATASASARATDPQLADAMLAAMRAPADFRSAARHSAQALIEDYALGPAPDTLFELIGYLAGGAKRRKAKLLAEGEDPDGDAATFDVLAALQAFGPSIPIRKRSWNAWSRCSRGFIRSRRPRCATPGEVHLTVDAVRYDTMGARGSAWPPPSSPTAMPAGDTLKVYLQKAHGFALPDDPA